MYNNPACIAQCLYQCIHVYYWYSFTQATSECVVMLQLMGCLQTKMVIGCAAKSVLIHDSKCDLKRESMNMVAATIYWATIQLLQRD